MKRFIFLTFLWLPNLIFAQAEKPGNLNNVYHKNIRSVQFHLAGLQLTNPVIELGSQGALELSFDDLDADVKDYVYTIQHCDANWEPSNLTELDYIDGFIEEKITDYNYSYNTIINYTHYRLILPNANMSWTKSGNYLLKIYSDENERSLAIIRRFMVVEPLMRVSAQLSPPSIVSKLKTHQEIDFIVSHKGIKVNNPQQDVKVCILQNGRWDNAICGIKPLFFKEETLIYDHQDKVVFPAGKEFRYIDIRSLRFRSSKVDEIQEYNNGFQVFLFADKDRSNMTYVSDEDVNGGFVIENLNEEDNELESDYASVIITLFREQPLEGKDVYVVGGFTDWQIKEEYKLIYYENDKVYEGEALLKQGFYNYIFATVDKKTGKIDMEELEGNWYETENEYTILVYFKPFGSRYDRLVAVQTIGSNR